MDQSDERRRARWRASLGAGAAAAVVAVGAVTAVTSAPAVAGGPIRPSFSFSGTVISPPPTRSTYQSLDGLVGSVGVTQQCGPAGPELGPYKKLGTGGVVPAAGQRVVKITVVGDAYVSGDGAGEYYNARNVLAPPMVATSGGGLAPPTGYTAADYVVDWRHRSTNAGPLLAVDKLRKLNPQTVFDVTFNASAGAETKHYFTAQNDSNRNNPPQYTGINSSTNLVVVGLGSNDAGLDDLVAQSVLDNTDAAFNAYLAERTALLQTRADDQEWADAIQPGTPTTLVSRYIQMVRDMRARAGQARVLLTTYPHALTVHHYQVGWLHHHMNLVRVQRLATVVPGVNAAMRRAQQILVNHGIQVDLLELRDVFNGHELGSADSWLNDLTIQEAPTAVNAFQQTAHPNRKGNQALSTFYARAIADQVGVYAPTRMSVNTASATASSCYLGLNIPDSPGGGGVPTGPTSGSTSTPPPPWSPPPSSPTPTPTPSGTPSPTPSGTPSPKDDTDSTTGFGDIDPITPVKPTDPTIPDGLENIPEIPIPQGDPPSGGTDPDTLPASSVFKDTVA